MNSSLSSLNSTFNNLSILSWNTDGLLHKTNTSLGITTRVAATALAEVNALALAFGLSLAFNEGGNVLTRGNFGADDATFQESVSSTSIYCTDITVYDTARVHGDATFYGHIDCTNGIEMNGKIYAILSNTDDNVVNTSISTPYLHCTNRIDTLLMYCDEMQTYSGMYVIGNASLYADKNNNFVINKISRYVSIS